MGMGADRTEWAVMHETSSKSRFMFHCLINIVRMKHLQELGVTIHQRGRKNNNRLTHIHKTYIHTLSRVIASSVEQSLEFAMSQSFTIIIISTL
jgi:hypothetical protein